MPEKNKESKVSDVIKVGELPLFRGAGERTHFKVSVLAVGGEPYTCTFQHPTSLSNQPVTLTRVLNPEEVAIEIEAPEYELSHGPFWANLRALRQARALEQKSS